MNHGALPMPRFHRAPRAKKKMTGPPVMFTACRKAAFFEHPLDQSCRFNRRHNKGPVTRRGLLLPNLHIKLFSQRKEVPLYCFLNPEQIIGSTAALRFFPSLRSGAAGCDLLLLTGYRAAGHPFWRTEVLPLPHYAKNLFPPYGSPAVCRSLTVFWDTGFFLHPTFTEPARLRSVTLHYIWELYIKGSCVTSRRLIIRYCPASPGSLSASFDMISSLCSDPRMLHHTHQYAHRPIG